jgi:hypothetical protein
MLEIDLRFVKEVGSISRRMSQYQGGSACTGSNRRLSARLDRTMETNKNQLFTVFQLLDYAESRSGVWAGLRAREGAEVTQGRSEWRATRRRHAAIGFAIAIGALALESPGELGRR